MLRKILIILILGPALLFGSLLLFHVIAIGGIYADQKSRVDHSTAASPAPEVARAAPAAVAPPAPAATPVPAAPRTYVVKKGDNPAAIARSFGISSADLLALNQIQDPRKLRIGAVLKLPAPKSHAP